MFKINIYRHNQPVTFSRRIITLLLDLLIITFATLFGFLACETLIEKNTSHPNNQNMVQAREIQTELISIIEESHLGYAVDGNICEAGSMAMDFIENIYLISLGDMEEAYMEPMISYYVAFKLEHAEKFSETGESVDAFDVSKDMLDATKERTKQYLIPTEKDSGLQLKEEAAIALKAWVTEEEEKTVVAGVTYNGAEIAEDLANMYKDLLVEARQEFTTQYQPYTEKYDLLSEFQGQMIRGKLIQLILVYAVVMTVYYLIIPLILGNGISLSNKLFFMVGCMKNGEEVPFWSVSIKWIMKMLCYFSVIYVVLILLYNINCNAFLNYRIWGNVKFSTFYFVSMVFILVSLICCAADKEKYRTLSDFISMQEMKDKRN